MKVLFQNRSDMYTRMGGDTIQLLKTREYLVQLGIDVDISMSYRQNLTAYDLIHIFNTTRIDETLLFLQNAKKYQKKVFLSSIYWNMDEFANTQKLVPSSRLLLKRVVQKFSLMNTIQRKRIFKQDQKRKAFIDLQQDIFMNVDAILPNSVIERDCIVRDFPAVNTKKFFVIPNGVDFFSSDQNTTRTPSFLDLENFVLCVGRIEERKNQYRLIKALSDNPLPLVLVGKYDNSYYCRMCKKLAGRRKNTFFLGDIPHHHLKLIYQKAKVHALPSWYETPGLANLEAALQGCTLAISDRGSVKEYFGKMAFYCSPLDETSIQKAVQCAYEAPRDDRLVQHIKNNFTWEIVAQKTLAAYHTVLNNAK